MKVLLLTPPLLQCNAPYAATPLLTAELRARGIEAVQDDASLALVLKLFSRDGLKRVRRAIGTKKTGPAGACFVRNFERYLVAIDPAVRLLQAHDPSIAYRIVSGNLIPKGPRFEVMAEQETDEGGTLEWAFGSVGVVDHACYLASLMLDDLSRVVREEIDESFGLSRYGESLAVSLPSLDPLLDRLRRRPSLVDRMIDEVAEEMQSRHAPGLVGFTVPFPGTLYGALRMARTMRRQSPALGVALGGGYVSTELRGLAEPRLFDLVDYVCLDEGGAPLAAVARHASNPKTTGLVRTFVRRGGSVVFEDRGGVKRRPRALRPPPAFDGLPLDRYVAVFEMLNPMHALWSRMRWNRIMLARGCYWRRCRFCDTTVDYIAGYEPVAPRLAVDWIERVAGETGTTGFHFVDEALSPALLRGMAQELIRRKLAVTWWGNVRFERAFTPALTELMASSGCVAVTGGLEAPDDRLLRLLDKGVTLASAAGACHSFARAGILVHAYLMYGIPSQTVQETVNCLERIRQLFEFGCLHSAFWHRFAATVHSHVGMNPAEYGISLEPQPAGNFARNGISFTDAAGADHEMLGRGLTRALYNYMHGIGFDSDIRSWFESPVARPTVKVGEIARLIRTA